MASPENAAPHEAEQFAGAKGTPVGRLASTLQQLAALPSHCRLAAGRSDKDHLDCPLLSMPLSVLQWLSCGGTDSADVCPAGKKASADCG